MGWPKPTGRRCGACSGEQRDKPSVRRSKALNEQYPRYCYPLLRALLKAEGALQNRRWTYRLYRELPIQVRPRRKEMLVRPGVPIEKPNGQDDLCRATCRHIDLGRTDSAATGSTGRTIVAEWSTHYNDVQPYGSSCYTPPARSAQIDVEHRRNGNRGQYAGEQQP